MFDIKDEVTGETLFYLIQIGLACDECLRHGLACTHKIDRLPHWKTAERQALVQSILASNPALANREAAGIINKSERYLFDRIFLDKLQKKTTYHWRFNPSVLFCAIDPAGGGSQSDFSVATLAFDTGQIVLLGLESTNKVQEKNIVCLLESHFRALRKIERYKDSFIFIFIERNYGGTFVTDTIKNIVEQSDFAPLQVVCCDIKKGDKPGVWVDEPTKQAMCGDLVRLLMEERLHFANPAEFITHRMSMNRKIRSDVLDCQKELIEQLSRVRDVISKTEKNEEVGIAKKITTGTYKKNQSTPGKTVFFC